MPRERQLAAGSEDPHAVPGLVDVGDKGRFGQIHLFSDLLHLVSGEVARVGEHRQLVTEVRVIGEDVELQEVHPYIRSGAETPSKESASAMTFLVATHRASLAAVRSASSVTTLQSR